jgi:hypothetical protein
MWRTRLHRNRKGERGSFSEDDYIASLHQAHQRLRAPSSVDPIADRIAAQVRGRPQLGSAASQRSAPARADKAMGMDSTDSLRHRTAGLGGRVTRTPAGDSCAIRVGLPES